MTDYITGSPQIYDEMLLKLTWIDRALSNIETIEPAKVITVLNSFRDYIRESRNHFSEEDIHQLYGYTQKAEKFCNFLIEAGVNPVHLSSVNTEVIPMNTTSIIRAQYYLDASYHKLIATLQSHANLMAEARAKLTASAHMV